MIFKRHSIFFKRLESFCRLESYWGWVTGSLRMAAPQAGKYWPGGHFDFQVIEPVSPDCWSAAATPKSFAFVYINRNEQAAPTSPQYNTPLSDEKCVPYLKWSVFIFTQLLVRAEKKPLSGSFSLFVWTVFIWNKIKKGTDPRQHNENIRNAQVSVCILSSREWRMKRNKTETRRLAVLE